MTPPRSPHQPPEPTGSGRRARAHRTGALLAAGALAVGLPAVALAPAASAAHGTKTPVTVKAAKRGALGKILVTTTGATLYDLPGGGSCTLGCLSVWPAYVLPAGQTTPRAGKGVTGLGTVTLPGGALQVTENGFPLYTFTQDTGHTTKGNGVAGFAVVPG